MGKKQTNQKGNKRTKIKQGMEKWKKKIWSEMRNIKTSKKKKKGSEFVKLATLNDNQIHHSFLFYYQQFPPFSSQKLPVKSLSHFRLLLFDDLLWLLILYSFCVMTAEIKLIANVWKRKYEFLDYLTIMQPITGI